MDRPVSFAIVCATLVRLRRPIETLQLARLAIGFEMIGPAIECRFDSVDGTCSDVVRGRRLGRTFANPSVAECVGKGVAEDSRSGLLDLLSANLALVRSVVEDTDDEVGGDETVASPDNAVVGAALAMLPDPDEELVGNGGILPPLNERRDDELAREPGRRGDGTPGV